MLPQFEIATYSSQIFWLVLVFSFLYLMISKVISPKVEAIVSNRDRVIEDNVLYARDLGSKAQDLEKEYKCRLAEASSHAEEIRTEALKELEAAYSERKKDIELEIKIVYEKVMSEMKQMGEAFEGSKKEAILDLADFMLFKIVQKAPDRSVLEKIYDRKK